MKKLVITAIIILLGSMTAKAQFPIPSYNTLVENRATFTEQAFKKFQIPVSEGKRQFNVKRAGSTKTLNGDVIFYAGSLDGQTLLGPYSIAPGETVSIEIDDRDWGIIVYTDIEVVLDVWITEGDPPGGEPQ
jgi:hypothetical protein